MLTKLAFRNVGKSFRDYAIYFLTLVTGVCVFYMFNSIYAQQELMEVTETINKSMQLLRQTLSIISVFVAVVMGFLIVYANNFFIKRRKREIGVYLTLGMNRRSISIILILETFVIAIGALVIGLILGIFGSQFMSVFTAKIFEADMSHFQFVFAPEATFRSVLYFGMIFLVVIFFNVYSVRKCKLIDLIYGGKKNERPILPNTGVSLAIFLAAVIMLITAYRLILWNGLININLWFALSLLLGATGAILFFFSLSGLLIMLVQRNKRIYLKGLNLFVLRQMGSKINTNFFSVSIVCLLLLLVIGVFSCGYSMQNVLSTELRASTPFDFSLYNNLYSDADGAPIEQKLPEEILHNTGVTGYAGLTVYKSGYVIGNLLTADGDNDRIKDIPLLLVSLSEYNQDQKLLGEKSLTLEPGQYVVSAGNDLYQKVGQSFLDNQVSIDLNGSTLFPNDKMNINPISNSAYFLYIIVEDSMIEGLPVDQYVLNINCASENDSKNFDELLEQYIKKIYQESTDVESAFTYYLSRSELYANSITTKAMVSFLAIYLGFVFMIVCAAVLAIQQLSEAADNRERYQLLKKLGTEQKMIHKALFMQILCYFVFPLGLAIIHSAIGLSAANEVIQHLGRIDVSQSIAATAGFVVAIYGSYFALTYFSSKSIIDKS